VLENSREAFVEESAELEEGFRVHASKNLNVVRYEFERDWGLKLNSFPWGIREKESEIYMDDVPIPGDEDVAIMSIFYLQEIC
jgi:hypothetical protein